MSGRIFPLLVGLACLLNAATPGLERLAHGKPMPSPVATQPTTQEPAVDSTANADEDPASLNVEFDTEGLEEFDSEEFDLGAVDPEADAKLRSTVQNVLIATGLIVMVLVGLVIYFRSRRRNRG